MGTATSPRKPPCPFLSCHRATVCSLSWCSGPAPGQACTGLLLPKGWAWRPPGSARRLTPAPALRALGGGPAGLSRISQQTPQPRVPPGHEGPIVRGWCCFGGPRVPGRGPGSGVCSLWSRVSPCLVWRRQHQRRGPRVTPRGPWVLRWLCHSHQARCYLSEAWGRSQHGGRGVSDRRREIYAFWHPAASAMT